MSGSLLIFFSLLIVLIYSAAGFPEKFKCKQLTFRQIYSDLSMSLEIFKQNGEQF